MTTIGTPPTSRAKPSVFRNRIVQIGLLIWILFAAAIPFLAPGEIPFDQPMQAAMPYRARVGFEIFGPMFALIFVGVTYLVTRRRSVDIEARAPAREIAMRETLGLLIYGAAVLLAGQLVGRLAGTHGIGLHLSGSMFGLTDSVTRREVYVWAIYNFVFYAALPYWFFRHRGYSREALCLKSSDPLNDTLVILVVLGLGLLTDLPSSHLWRLNSHQLAVGGVLALVFSLLGTGLPIMIFLTSILVPRYQRLTGSTPATMVLSGFTYASLHLTEHWTRYDTPAHAALSVIFIVLLFGGPGMVKSYLTLRTGNAWVHLWGYHVIWPHVTGDTPIFAKIFGIE
jgi:hypothetical protein